MADIVDYHLGMYGTANEEQPTTQTAAALFQELCYDNKDQLRWVMLGNEWGGMKQRANFGDGV